LLYDDAVSDYYNSTHRCQNAGRNAMTANSGTTTHKQQRKPAHNHYEVEPLDDRHDYAPLSVC
jgi:hypothetical protein